MNTIKTPVFLVGSVRSGTTLLRLMLDHHPKIAFNLESEYFVSQMSDDGRFPEMPSFRDWLRHDRVFHHSELRIDESLDYRGLVNDFLLQKLSRDGKEIAGATVHVKFARLRHLWTDAKYIYICRDGRDVANSVMRMGWAGNVYAAADFWLNAEREWDILCPHLQADNWIVVRSEELVARPQEELARICRFIGTEYNEKMLEYSKQSTYASPDVKLNYQWKRSMKPSDIQLLEAKLAERLQLRGYEMSGHPRISISGFGRQCLYWQSRMKRYAFRLQRYGFFLTLQETLARRLGLRELHRRKMRQMNEITDALVK